MRLESCKSFLLALPLMAACIATPAMAQYVWIDANNVRHYSDKPPPASVPASRILRTPRGGPLLTYEPVAKEASSGAKSESASSKTPLTMAEKNAEFQKRRMEQAEKDKKAEQEARRAEEKAKYCDGLRERKRVMESGHRLARMNDKGERYFMNDEQRSRELEEVNRNLEERCK